MRYTNIAFWVSGYMCTTLSALLYVVLLSQPNSCATQMAASSSSASQPIDEVFYTFTCRFRYIFRFKYKYRLVASGWDVNICIFAFYGVYVKLYAPYRRHAPPLVPRSSNSDPNANADPESHPDEKQMVAPPIRIENC